MKALRETAKRLYQAGCDLIPIVPFGKKPVQNKWTTRPRTSSSELREAIKRGCNIGHRLKDTDLIIDVDVKGGKPGLESYETLTIDYPELHGTPHCTHTPSGGFHIWLTKSPGKINKTHGDYPGIDFLSQGAQVLIGGSKTETGDYIDKGVTIFPAAPELLIEALNRAPVSSQKLQKSGAWDDIKLAEALAMLDVTKHRTDEDWLRIAMACHHATNGRGKDAFLDWSAGDPLYGLPSKPQNELRWDSFYSDRTHGVTGAYLAKLLREAGALDFAEELTTALIDVRAMFEVEDNPEADLHAAAADMINQWDEPYRMNVLYESLVKGNFDESTMDQFAEMIRRRFKIRVGTIRLGFLKAAAAINRDTDDSTAIGDEVELIKRLIASHGGRESLINSEGRLWVWRQDLGHYREAVGDEVGGIVMAYANAASEILSPGAVSRLERILRAETASVVWDNFWDGTGEGIINTQAGEVTLGDEGWEIGPHEQTHRLRNITNFEFGHEGTPKHWSSWLEDAFTADQRDTMSRRIAVGIVYTLMSSKPFLKKAWLLYGPPNTGKSMLIKVLGKILGGRNYSSTGLSKMLGNHGTAPLVGKMANFQSEIDVAENVDAATFKAVVSGDYTEANPKNMHQFMFQNRAVLWLAGNNLPKFAMDTTSGVIDRLVPVAFRNAVAPEKIDRGLERKLNRESNKIVTWALWLYNEEAMFDFPCLELSGESEIEAELKAEMATDESRFAEECIEVTKDTQDFVSTEDLLERFTQWNPGFPPSKVGFARMLAKQLRYIPGLREGKDYRFGKSSTVPQRRGVFGVKIKEAGNDM